MEKQLKNQCASDKVLPSADFLRECFSYNFTTGELCWKARPKKHFSTERIWLRWNTRFSGKSAGWLSDQGYCKITFVSKHFLAHRIIWKLVTGFEPPKTIDHIDRDRGNNCWSNLQVATRVEQRWNSRFYKSNTSGYRGVYSASGRWRAQIRIAGVTRHLGRFSTKEEAYAVYRAVARKLHGEFYREDADGQQAQAELRSQ